MPGEERVELVTPGGRWEADPTPGMVREQAIGVEGLWAGLVRTGAHVASGWHHHGDHETAIYVVEGTLRMEFGPSGEDVLEAGPGDFLRVPRNVVHRETNSGDRESRIVVVRSGNGPTTVNVASPTSPGTGGSFG